MSRASSIPPLISREPPATPPARAALPRRARELWLAAEIRERPNPPNPPNPPNRPEGEPLEALAAWAHALTPRVSLERPDGLLLEVRGSLKLFGGLAPVKEKLAAELDRRRLCYAASAAPTPRAALWLARSAAPDVLDAGALAGRLSVLPLAATRWPADVLELLAQMGVGTVGDCLRLPRAGFARRAGEAYLRQLDEALGKRPDLKLEHESRPVVSATLELCAEVTQTHALAEALQRLVAGFAADLRNRQRQAQDLHVVFHHARRPATVSRLQLVEPAHEAQRLLAPLVARLERTVLPAPVIALTLRAEALAMLLEAPELFAGAAEPGGVPESRAALVERLRARFGVESVCGLGCVDDHRPERGWAKITDDLLHARAGAEPRPGAADRPLWILPAPVPCTAGGGAGGGTGGRAGGGAARGEEPERIESGWWDGNDVARDYYAVTTGRGERLWVYRDRTTHDWYLHGFFG